jgi:predicted enzyme related to lactoylglutathione lyase
MEMPAIPPGSGEHPICLTVITASNLESSSKFYSELFAWTITPLSAEVAVVQTTAGQAAALRTGLPEGYPSAVPFVKVDSVDALVVSSLGMGFTLDKEKWSAPNVGTMARVKAPSGVVYGFIEPEVQLVPTEALPSPFGAGPKPPVGSICAIELHSSNFPFAAQYIKDNFGWGSAETMPQYMGFDTGAGYSGVFQGHTPTLPVVAYIYVEDVAAKLTELEAAGGQRIGEPMSMPGFATFLYFTDPSGTTMGLIGPA